MIITDLNDQIYKAGTHALFTGTFNPPHVGHTRAIKECFQQITALTSAVVIPHDWNHKKSPPLDTEIRIQWIKDTILEFIPDLANKVFILKNPVFLETPDSFDALCNKNKDKIYRIVGSDKLSVLVGNKNRAKVLLTQRSKYINSTIIRDSTKRQMPEQIKDMLAKPVLEEILINHYYF